MSSPNEAPSPDQGFDAADAKIDALLRDFFRAETPASLPPTPLEAPDDWTSFAPTEAYPVSRSSKWDFAAPALLASVAVLMVCGLWMLPHFQPSTTLTKKSISNDEPPQPTPAMWTPDVVGFPQAPTSIKSRSKLQDVDDGEVAVTITEGNSLVDLKYYSTSIGTIEQRTNVEWTTLRVFEPKSGEWLQATVPTVRIEVVPLEQ
jgi:hypothetical protein